MEGGETQHKLNLIIVVKKALRFLLLTLTRILKTDKALEDAFSEKKYFVDMCILSKLKNFL